MRSLHMVIHSARCETRTELFHWRALVKTNPCEANAGLLTERPSSVSPCVTLRNVAWHRCREEDRQLQNTISQIFYEKPEMRSLGLQSIA
jgi:hypothetical protein